MNEIDEDFVEDFARQLDSIVRIQEQHQEEEDEEESFNEDTSEYQQIPQDEEDMYQQLMSEEEEIEEEVEVDLDAPLVIKVEPSNQLNSETSDLIRSIMSNIQLSNDAIPDWAKKIPEDAWLPRVKEN
ncbi:hypothetical protein A0J61_00057 [Choanephora cucurbitarum]|uniref:Male-enhanced antigen 1 n=1 Tax=Choanephora cucurbitarum TaxID=101091 RepID=A0A1C7NWR6_9FUNG|nr:hypothetical protein A0J61_00057 [Choanephora cucurbitarum]